MKPPGRPAYSVKIKALRTAKGWTQDSLAMKLYVSKSMVVRWESGTAEPTATNLINMAKIFDVSIDYIIKE